MLRQILCFDPAKRLTAVETLRDVRHPDCRHQPRDQRGAHPTRILLLLTAAPPPLRWQPYLAQYHSDDDDHITLPHKHADWLQAVSNTDQLPKEQLQNLIFQEILFFHPEVARGRA